MIPTTVVQRGCVVCGQGSGRTDWLNTKTVGDKTYVACDNHSTEEYSKAVDKASGRATAQPPAPSKPAVTSTGQASTVDANKAREEAGKAPAGSTASQVQPAGPTAANASVPANKLTPPAGSPVATQSQQQSKTSAIKTDEPTLARDPIGKSSK